LTHNWDTGVYSIGTGYGHIAISVDDIYATCTSLQTAGVPVTRQPGPMQHDPNEVIAFIEDPDGYRIELIEIQT
jgi:lactoylglutathione lyase